MTEPKTKPPQAFHQTPLFRGVAIAVLIAAGIYWYRSGGEASDAPSSGVKIDALEKSIADGKPNFGEAPACGADSHACLDSVAKYLGSKTTFNLEKPDQASCATVALVLLRDKHGDVFQNPKPWMEILKIGKGNGVDALRGAVAIAMADHAADVGKKFDDGNSLMPLISAVSASIPGSCDTYAALARGDKMESMTPQLSPEHSACVQNDLSRREGPGGRYGAGGTAEASMFRTAEGAAAVWREEERALRIGIAQASPGIQKLVTEKLAIIEPLTQKIEIKKLADAEPYIMSYIGNVHEEAGIRLWKNPVDGGVDAAAPTMPIAPLLKKR